MHWNAQLVILKALLTVYWADFNFATLESAPEVLAIKKKKSLVY